MSAGHGHDAAASHDDHAPKGKVLTGSVPGWLVWIIVFPLGYWIQFAQPNFTALNAQRTSVKLSVDSKGLSKKITNFWDDWGSSNPTAPRFKASKPGRFWVRLADGYDYPSDNLPPDGVIPGKREYLYHTIQVAAEKGDMIVNVYINVREAAESAASKQPPQIQAEAPTVNIPVSP